MSHKFPGTSFDRDRVHGSQNNKKNTPYINNNYCLVSKNLSQRRIRLNKNPIHYGNRPLYRTRCANARFLRKFRFGLNLEYWDCCINLYYVPLGSWSRREQHQSQWQLSSITPSSQRLLVQWWTHTAFHLSYGRKQVKREKPRSWVWIF